MRVTACVKCDGRRLLHLPRLADLVGVKYVGEMVTVRELGRVAHPDRDASRGAPSTIRIGVLQALVCAACGYFELYTKDPDRIWVDGQAIQRRAR